MRPLPGYCLVHDGNIKHAGNEVLSGERFILVGFYNADGRDRAGEEQYFGRKAREEARLRAQPPPPLVQTIYFTTAVASLRGSAESATGITQTSLPPLGPSVDEGVTERKTGRPFLAMQKPDFDRSVLSTPRQDGYGSAQPANVHCLKSALAESIMAARPSASSPQQVGRMEAASKMPPKCPGPILDAHGMDPKSQAYQLRNHRLKQALQHCEGLPTIPTCHELPSHREGQLSSPLGACLPNWMQHLQSRLRAPPPMK